MRIIRLHKIQSILLEEAADCFTLLTRLLCFEEFRKSETHPDLQELVSHELPLRIQILSRSLGYPRIRGYKVEIYVRELERHFIDDSKTGHNLVKDIGADGENAVAGLNSREELVRIPSEIRLNSQRTIYRTQILLGQSRLLFAPKNLLKLALAPIKSKALVQQVLKSLGLLPQCQAYNQQIQISRSPREYALFSSGSAYELEDEALLQQARLLRLNSESALHSQCS